MFKALESNQNKAHNIVKETALPSNNVILEDLSFVLKDFITHNYGENPTQEKVLEMRNATFKGATYQRKEKSTPTKRYKPKVTTPIINPLVVVESKLDMGMWSKATKVSAYATDIHQIPGQKEKLLNALESNHNKSHDIVKETALPSNNVILEDLSFVLKDFM